MILILIMAFFGWISITWVMRTMTYREKEREYILAVRSLGASHMRIIFRHIIPNTISVIVTYAPFAVSGRYCGLNLPGLPRVRPACTHPPPGENFYPRAGRIWKPGGFPLLWCLPLW